MNIFRKENLIILDKRVKQSTCEKELIFQLMTEIFLKKKLIYGIVKKT